MPNNALALIIAALAGCKDPQDDSGADDSGVDSLPDATLAESYDHTCLLHLVPNENGALFGLTECDFSFSATITLDPGRTACADCDGFYGGPVLAVYTTCSGVSYEEDTAEYGLAAEEGGIRVWTFDPKPQVWTDEGVAAEVGDGTFEVVTTELIGDKTFSLGETTITYRFVEI
jgi:hypothetical protein